MTKLADELRQIAIAGTAKDEIDRFKKLLKKKNAEGFREYQIAEFYYSEHDSLGKLKVDFQTGSWKAEGPIKEIISALQEEGFGIIFNNELRYVSHPKGSGVVTLVKARW